MGYHYSVCITERWSCPYRITERRMNISKLGDDGRIYLFFGCVITSQHRRVYGICVGEKRDPQTLRSSVQNDQ